MVIVNLSLLNYDAVEALLRRGSSFYAKCHLFFLKKSCCLSFVSPVLIKVGVYLYSEALFFAFPLAG